MQIKCTSCGATQELNKDHKCIYCSSAIEQEKVIGAICNAASFMAKCGIDRETTSKTLQKSSVIQKISVTLSSVIIAIIVCKLLIFNTLRLQQFFANHHFSGTYISSNSR